MIDIDSIPADTPPVFAYLLSKAEKYLKVGPEVYRAEDFFKMPRKENSKAMLAVIQRGMEQICKFCGYSRDNPFKGLGIDGFYALLSTLHFEVAEQQFSSDGHEAIIIDEMHMKHRVTGQRIVLYNAVPTSRVKGSTQQRHKPTKNRE